MSTACFTRLACVIGTIMALGALFGIVKVIYAAVRVRTRALLGAIGALSGAAIAWLMFDGALRVGGLPPFEAPRAG